MTSWRRLTFSFPPAALDDLITCLHEAGTLGAEVRGERLDAYFAEPLDEATLLETLRLEIGSDAVPRLESSEPMPDGFWHERWMESLVPFEVGDSFVVVPGPATPADARGRRVIRLTPGRAFGTGEHATTRMSLMMIEKEVTAAGTLLDVGTGSGILAIGALLSGAGRVVAIDTDPDAVATAARNALINDAGEPMFVAGGVEALRVGLRFDTVVANITGAALVRLMDSLCALSARALILSGILSEEEEEVTGAARRNGFAVTSRHGDEWVALTLKRGRV